MQRLPLANSSSSNLAIANGPSNGRSPSRSLSKSQSSPAMLSLISASSSSTQLMQTFSKLPDVVTSRISLDAKSMSPAMLALRANPRNMVNEARLGLPYSTNYALLRPKPRVQWEKLPVLQKPKGYKRALQKMQQKLGQGVWANQYSPTSTQVTQSSPVEQHRRKPVEDEAPKKEVPEVTDERITKIFEELEDGSGKVKRTQFKRALELNGFIRPDPALVDASVQSLWSEYRIKGQHWTLPEFGVAVSAFEQRWQAWVKEQFDLNDMDRSGTVSNSAELRSLAKSLDFILMPEAVDELKNAADVDGDGQLSFEEFLAALQILRVRHGFTEDEVAHFMNVFEKYDKDKSGEITASELDGVLNLVGFPCSEEGCQALIDEVDLDGTGALNRDEFLMVMRICREKEVHMVEEIFSKHDTDYSGTVSEEELRLVLLEVGYTMSTRVLREVAQDSKFSELKWKVRGSMEVIPIQDQVERFKNSSADESNLHLDFIFEDFMKILKLYRMREGFLLQEISDFYDAFDRHDGNGSGEIEPFEFTRILSWLGFPSTPSLRQSLWQKVDVDGSNCLEKDEFLKLMRLYYENEARHIRDYFESLHADVRSTVPVNLAELHKLVISMEYNPPQDRLAEAAKCGSKGTPNISFEGILGLLAFLRLKRVQDVRANAGLPEGEVVKIKRMFSRLDKDGSGDLELVELQKFLVEICPQLKHSKAERARMDRIVSDADDGSGGLTLMETLWVVRNYRDELEEEKWNKEQNMIDATGFSNKEITNFREIFQAADADGSGFLSEREVVEVVGNIEPLTGPKRRALYDKIAELDEDGDRQSSFVEFIQLMQVVLPPAGARESVTKEGKEVTIQEEPEMVEPNQDASAGPEATIEEGPPNGSQDESAANSEQPE